MNLRLSLVRVVLLCAIASVLLPAQAQDTATLQRKAQAGNAEAQYQLAGAYFSGEGVARDPKQGLVWLRKSAGQGYVWAEKALGVMYLKGEQTVSQNPHEAAVWFRKAARQQNKPAQASLAQMLADGVVSKQEANWRAPDQVVEVKTATSKPFSLGEVEKGLQGGITCKRLAALVDKFKVDFALTTDMRQRLGKEGADDNLLTIISVSKRSL
jgi:hypothetical protein